MSSSTLKVIEEARCDSHTALIERESAEKKRDAAKGERDVEADYSWGINFNLFTNAICRIAHMARNRYTK